MIMLHFGAYVISGMRLFITKLPLLLKLHAASCVVISIFYWVQLDIECLSDVVKSNGFI